MSTVKKSDFERIEGGKTIRERNRIQAKKEKNFFFFPQIKISSPQISKDKRNAKWSKIVGE